jgi:uncharacterized membrane protein
MKRAMACLLLWMVVLAGCATDKGLTQAEGTGVGAGVGAALGALIGYAAGGERGALIGAASGAAVGAGGGYALGTHVANQKEKYVKQEDYLNAVIDSARQMNEQTRRYNASLRDQVNALDHETISLVEQYNRKTLQKVELKKREKIISEKIVEVQDQLHKVRNEFDIQRKVFAQEKGQYKEHLKQLQEQIFQLESNKLELEGHIYRLASIKTRVAV